QHARADPYCLESGRSNLREAAEETREHGERRAASRASKRGVNGSRRASNRAGRGAVGKGRSEHGTIIGFRVRASGHEKWAWAGQCDDEDTFREGAREEL